MAIVAVDDRSTDGGGEVLRALDLPNLRLRRVDQLPAGWLGKCHACRIGAAACDEADWLLFVDSDSRLDADLVARAVRVAERQGAGHLCLIPDLDGQTFWGRSVSLTMSLGLVLQAGRLEDDRQGAYMGVGAFNLVRRDLYLRIGGHERLRMEVLDDIGLARLLRLAGARSRIRFAPRWFRVTWITTLRSAITVTEKNYFAMRHFAVLPFAAGCGVVALSWAAVLGAPVVATPLAAGLALTGLGAMTLATLPIATRYGWSRALLLGVPFVVPVIVVAMLNSMIRTLRQGGIAWRGTFYPLPALRAGDVRRRAQSSSLFS